MGKAFFKATNGLRFECTSCGDCCTRPGSVYFSALDVERAASMAQTTPADFRRRHGIRREDGLFVHDPGPDDPCTFYDETEGCTIYEARPVQCRTWPFWPEVVGRRRAWKRAARECEGIGRGKRFSVTEIERALTACKEADLPEGDPW